MEELPEELLLNMELLSPALCNYSREKDTPMVRKLLEAGADVNFRFDSGFSPLLLAAYSGAHDVIKILIEAGADVNVAAALEEDSPCWSPLMMAVGRGDVEMFNLLMASGADVNYQNGHGETALTRALDFPYMDSAESIVKALIQAGADVNTKTTSENYDHYEGCTPCTPLMIAILTGHEEMVKILIAAGSDLNHRNGKGETALLMAFLYGCKETEIVKPLVDAGADVNVSADWNEMKFTPLMHAAKAKEKELCKVLIDAGAEVGEISLIEGWKKTEHEINDFLTRLQQEGTNDE